MMMKRSILWCALVVGVGTLAAMSPSQARPVLANADPHILALPLPAYPSGAAIVNEHVDWSASAVTAEGLFGATYKQGERYRRLGFRGTLVQKVRLPAFDGVSRALWLLATIFPAPSAALQAFTQDGAPDHCLSQPAADLPLRYATCGYSDASTHESGLYVAATAGPVEFNILGIVGLASTAALQRATRDALYLARKEAGHVLHLVQAGAVVAVAPPAEPTATATPATSTQGSGNALCPQTLHNADWAHVNLRPDLYIGCAVDIAGLMYHAQVLAGAVSFNTQLNPTNGPDWTVFAMDYDNTPPTIADQTWVRVQGTIENIASAQDTTTGAFTGYVPQVRIAQIAPISPEEAQQRGAQ